jgi:hypothetical protein
VHRGVAEMKSLFIATIRNEYTDRQKKFTIECGNCMIRVYRLYPFQDIMIAEKNVTQKQFIKLLMQELTCNAGATSGANIYFNGNNYRKFMNTGRSLW